LSVNSNSPILVAKDLSKKYDYALFEDINISLLPNQVSLYGVKKVGLSWGKFLLLGFIITYFNSY